MLTSSSIIGVLNDFKVSFHGMLWDLNPFRMKLEIEKNEAQISKVLNYAKSSEEGFQVCTNYIFDGFNKYIELFKPGTEIDEVILEKILRGFPVKEHPGSGLNIYAYLLLELTKYKRSLYFTKTVLETLYDTYLASCYRVLASHLYEYPEDEEVKNQLEMMKNGTGIFGGTNLSWELAWCCEKFMVDMHSAEEPFLPASATAVIGSYLNWREDKTVGLEEIKYLPWHYFRETMKTVDKLIKALSTE